MTHSPDLNHPVQSRAAAKKTGRTGIASMKDKTNVTK